MQRWVKRWVPVAAIAGAILAGGGAAFASSGASASGTSAPSTSSTPVGTVQAICPMPGAAYGPLGMVGSHGGPNGSKSGAVQSRSRGLGQTGASQVGASQVGANQAGASQNVMHRRGTGLENAPGGVMGEVLKVLNINPATFIQDRQSGMSIADIAKKQGVTEQKVIDAMKTKLTERMNLAVQNGRLTAEQAQQIQTGLETHLKTKIEQSGATGGMRGSNAGWWVEGVDS